MRVRGRAGFTLVEVLLALVVFAMVSLSIARAIVFFSRQGTQTRRKAFAAEKAAQMLEELRSVVTANGNVAVLDNYNDGTSKNPVLTTNLSVSNAADASSGNGSGQFYRRVTVAPMPNDASARQVYVAVYDASSNVPLAQAMSVLRTVPHKFYPSEVFDVYFIAIDNVPGWWVLTSKLRPIMDGVVQNLQAINPGLVIRSHWITRMAYGRDPYYTPWINSSALGTADAVTIPNAYFYPGWTNNPTVGQEYYYDPTQMYGRLNVDGAAGSAPNTSTASYSYADEFNHAMRAPDEFAAYAAAVASATAAGQAAPEPSLSMLLAEMNDPNKPLQNLLLMNLHGEMLPMPPIRNYSDAAKDPSNYPGYRAVTHPQYLQYGHGSGVKLRVYTYLTPEYVDATPTTAALPLVSVYLPQVAVPATSITVRKLVGGTTSYSYGWTNAVNTAACVNGAPGQYIPSGGDDYCVKTTGSGVGGTTEIVLSSSPVRQAQLSSIGGQTYGLNASMRLYGMEYVPSPPQAVNLSGGATDYAEGINDLSSLDGPSPVAKNTARWVIQIAPGALPDTVVSTTPWTVQTRIGSDLTTGPTSPNRLEWSNNSDTFVWMASTPPVTEQFQFMGDPRYEPYVDAKSSSSYNWDFVDVSTNSNGSGYAYQGYSNTNSGYGGGNGWGGTVSYDAPRYYQLYRQGLLNSTGLWTTMSGWSFYYAAIGGDFGDDGTLGYTHPGIPISRRPWSSTGAGGTAYVNEIVNDSGYSDVNARLIASANNSWVNNPWTGELYPDAAFGGATGWAATGNLPTVVSGSGYYRAEYSGATFGPASDPINYSWNPEKRVGGNGAPSFFNAYPLSGSAAKYFQHQGASDNGQLTSVGSAMSGAFNYALLPSLTAVRPFRLDAAGAPPPQWNNAVYKSQKTQSSIVNTTYSDGSNPALTAAALLKLQTGTSSGSQGAYMAVNGVGAQTSFGSNDIAQLSLASMMYGYMEAGAPGTSVGDIHQIPLLSISSPTVTQQFVNPTSIEIDWGVSWTRWGGQPYTTAYPSGYADATVSMVYNVKVSADNGNTWSFLDGTPAQFGVENSAEAATSPVSWNVSTLAQGTYLIDVEGYRVGYPLHYTYEEQSVYIQR